MMNYCQDLQEIFYNRIVWVDIANNEINYLGCFDTATLGLMQVVCVADDVTLYDLYYCKLLILPCSQFFYQKLTEVT
jgi:hypothetical protein